MILFQPIQFSIPWASKRFVILGKNIYLKGFQSSTLYSRDGLDFTFIKCHTFDETILSTWLTLQETIRLFTVKVLFTWEILWLPFCFCYLQLLSATQLTKLLFLFQFVSTQCCIGYHVFYLGGHTIYKNYQVLLHTS